jgi:hypothetical protein
MTSFLELVCRVLVLLLGVISSSDSSDRLSDSAAKLSISSECEERSESSEESELSSGIHSRMPFCFEDGMDGGVGYWAASFCFFMGIWGSVLSMMSSSAWSSSS